MIPIVNSTLRIIYTLLHAPFVLWVYSHTVTSPCTLVFLAHAVSF